MKSKSLNKLINKARNGLDWLTVEKPHEMDMIRIASYPRDKLHVILIPDKLHNRSTDLDYLHELGHATYCEKIHPVFAANIQFVPYENKQQFLQIIPALNAACDWFIGHWQIKTFPKTTRDQLKETTPIAEDVLSSPKIPPLEIILDASMVIAQAIYYLEEPIDCGGPLKLAVDAFLSIPPDKPSLEDCVLLINRLLATYSDQQVRFNDAGDLSSWEVYLSNDVKRKDMATSLRKCDLP